MAIRTMHYLKNSKKDQEIFWLKPNQRIHDVFSGIIEQNAALLDKDEERLTTNGGFHIEYKRRNTI